MKWNDAQTARVCRGLALLLHAGIHLADGLFLLAREEDKFLAPGLEALGRAMDAGDSLPMAAENSGLFPEEAVGMLHTGDQSGRMEEALNYLAEYYDARERTMRQIKNALAYPSLVLALMLLVIGVLLVKVLPVFDSVYASLGSRLTGIAGGLLGLGQSLSRSLPVLLGVLALGGLLFLTYRLYRPFRERMDRFFLEKLGDRSVLRKFNNAQFARALAMGLGSGLGLEEAVELARKLLAHIPGAAARCDRCLAAMAQGEDMVQALEGAALLPRSQSSLLALGIRGGSGDRVMADIADRLSEDAFQSLESAVSRIEPAMVLICSALVGLILLAVMLPLMNILSAIG